MARGQGITIFINNGAPRPAVFGCLGQRILSAGSRRQNGDQASASDTR
jgi:hypothetical protein